MVTCVGSTLGFGMSLDGASTYDNAIDFDSSLSAGYQNTIYNVIAPLGMGIMTTASEVDVGATVHYGHHFSVSASRASDSHYEYPFNFEYDFSTSSDPFIAGAASDVIIGGGVDLVVNEAIKGFIL